MPVCYQLYRKGQKSPEPLVKVDEAICTRFGWPCDERVWAKNWHNIIGLLLALGYTWPQVRKNLEERKELEALNQIAEFLEQEYEVISFRE